MAVFQLLNKKKSNQWGLYDMSGNVYEWCLDDFVENPTGRLDPLVQYNSEHKVGRGGSYRSKEASIRTNNRSSTPPNMSTEFIGFRLVRTAVTVE